MWFQFQRVQFRGKNVDPIMPDKFSFNSRGYNSEVFIFVRNSAHCMFQFQRVQFRGVIQIKTCSLYSVSIPEGTIQSPSFPLIQVLLIVSIPEGTIQRVPEHLSISISVGFNSRGYNSELTFGDKLSDFFEFQFQRVQFRE